MRMLTVTTFAQDAVIPYVVHCLRTAERPGGDDEPSKKPACAGFEPHVVGTATIDVMFSYDVSP